MPTKQRHRTSRITPASRKQNHRVRLDLKLTTAEIRQLKAAAESDVRSIGNYVGWVVAQHLKSKRKKPRPTDASGVRKNYNTAVVFMPDELAALEARAEEQRRSVSGYVTLLVLEALESEGG